MDWRFLPLAESDKQGTQHSPLGGASLDCAAKIKYGSDTGERDAEKTYLESSKAIEKLSLFLYLLSK